MVRDFTEMEEHYYGEGIIQEALMKDYLCKSYSTGFPVPR